VAAEAGVAAVERCPGVIMPFPGGIAGSGSKAGSKYKFTIASTYEKFCPALRENPAAKSEMPAEVQSVMEIIMNGRDLESIAHATQAAIEASVDTPGLLEISAGNYGGRLGKSFVYLRPERQQAVG
jgi:formylmethanofuran--tetrahydromethanopterin N-formyltransferase